MSVCVCEHYQKSEMFIRGGKCSILMGFVFPVTSEEVSEDQEALFTLRPQSEHPKASSPITYLPSSDLNRSWDC